MIRYWVYFKSVCWHKYCVFMAGYGIVPIRFLLAHDWHKFLPDEFGPYARNFYNEDGSKRHFWELGETEEFKDAWNCHQKRARHHHQFHVMREDDGNVIVRKMKLNDVNEMIADWRGAGRSHGDPDTLGWYLKNRHKMLLHVETRAYIEEVLGVPDNARTISD